MDVPILSTFAQPALLHPSLNHSNGLPTEVKTILSTESQESASTSQVSVILTVRLLMQGKEVGSIIGKRGDHIKFIRDKSGAKINISDGSCAERIVTITGTSSTINNAFHLIASKFEEDMQAFPNSVPKPPITMRLIIPATQCGSIIGKGGIKIKEIREKTGASIQVASEMLPNSTERAVTISGACEALVECMKQICIILQEAPPKGSTLPFRPKPTYNPMLLANSVASAAAAQQNQLIQQIQAQQQNQQTTNALMQMQYGQSNPIYTLVQSNTSKSPTASYPQFQAMQNPQFCPELQNALLNNFALAANPLQLAQQYPMSIEEMQSALLGSPSLAASLLSGWPTTDTSSLDLLNQIPANFATQQSIRANAGKNITDGIQLGQSAGPVHNNSNKNGTGRSNSLTNGTSNRRFTPY